MRKITHIRMADSEDNSTKKIEKVKCVDMITNKEFERMVRHVIIDIKNIEDLYYCIGKDNKKSKIQVVKENGIESYIRSSKNDSEEDNLLSLPRF